MITPLLDRAGVPAEVTKRFGERLDLPAGHGHETADGPSAASGTATATPASPAAKASGTKASPAAKADSTTASDTTRIPMANTRWRARRARS